MIFDERLVVLSFKESAEIDNLIDRNWLLRYKPNYLQLLFRGSITWLQQSVI